MFTHSADPMEAEDWLRAVERDLQTAQCTDREMVLYGSVSSGDLLKIGGMHTCMPMQPQIPSPGKNSELVSDRIMCRRD